MVRFTCNGFHIFIFMILVAMETSFSHARQVKEVKVAKDLTNERELVVEGDINFSLHKETQRDAITNAEAVETLNKISRKMTADDMSSAKKTSKEKTRKSEQDRNSKRVTMAAGHDGEQNWKDYFMADYRTPKSHPPKNN